jgi:glycosyltransferase involved in cell wall biosynthesis
MDKKKILIVGRTFFPELSPRSFRTTELAKEFARQGHEVTVLLPKNLEEILKRTFNNEYRINFIFYGPLHWKVFQKSKYPFVGDLKRKFGRLLFLLFEYPNIEIYFKLPKVLKKLNGFDLLLSIAVPHENHWAIAKVKTAKHPIAKKWVADCGDPFMTNVLETIAPPFYFGFLERNFLKKADYVTVPTEGSIKAYDTNFKQKFKVIPQGFNFKEIQLIEEKPIYECPNFAYAGGVSTTGVRSLHQVVLWLKSQDKKFKFHIFSNTAKSALTEVIKGHEDFFVLQDAIPRDVLLFELSKMDFLLNLDNGTHLNTPSKLIDYALTKRPVVNVNPINFKSQFLEQFLNGDYTNQSKVENIEKYNIETVANLFLKL